MRKGEILGLKWQDLNDAESTLQVRRILSRIPSSMGRGLVEAEPKTKKSRRSILLPPFVLEALQQHRLLQHEVRAKAGPKWQEGDLIFCSSSGLPLNPNHVLETLKQVLKEAGLPPPSVSTTCATAPPRSCSVWGASQSGAGVVGAQPDFYDARYLFPRAAHHAKRGDGAAHQSAQ
jgi:integrase